MGCQERRFVASSGRIRGDIDSFIDRPDGDRTDDFTVGGPGNAGADIGADNDADLYSYVYSDADARSYLLS